MIEKNIEVPVGDGVLAGLDFGGSGVPVLLVHGTGHNAAAWTDVAARLVSHCRPVAVDLRGHGKTGLDSADPERYWRDLGAVVRFLGWSRPLLVGHSTGGYAVTAATAAGLVEPAAICVVDGVVLDDRDAAISANARWRTPEASQQLRDMFRYGWAGDREQVDAYVERCVNAAAEDWLNAGARPDLVRAVTERSFLRRADRWLRRPTTDEIATVSNPDPTAAVYPSVDVYERVTCPMTIVLADRGLYAGRRAEAQAVADARPGRRLVVVDSNHNVPMTRPDEVAGVIVDLAARRRRPSDR
jgi:pimeloyl-ACP methyl ester carboxylesterase